MAHPMGHWPLVSDLVSAEIDAYHADDLVSGAGAESRPTRCVAWTVRDVTVHMAETFRRFSEMLEQSRRGDFTQPFGADELDAENQRAVEQFTGDPAYALVAESARFLGLVAVVADPDEPIAHQLGTITVGLQVRFGLGDVAIHHDDVAAAAGRRYRPPDSVVAAVAEPWSQLRGGLPDAADEWDRVILASGRTV